MFKGVAASVLASCLFGAIYYLSPFLQPLDGEQILGWRVLCTVPLTTALVLLRGEWPQVVALLGRIRCNPWLMLPLVLSAFLLGFQMWLFMWAPLHGKALPVSLGYFLLPLAMVLAGRVLYGERLSRWQIAASWIAALGVLHEIVRMGGMGWESVVVSVGYTLYFWLRRKMGTEGMGGHWIDMALMLPIALYFVVRAPGSWPLVTSHDHLPALLALMGLISCAALALYMAAHRWLPMGLFGLLSYVEPVLLVLVAWLLGESLAPGQWPTYALVFVAVALLVLEGVFRLRQDRRAKAGTPRIGADLSLPRSDTP